jgi:hypothetical protein
MINDTIDSFIEDPQRWEILFQAATASSLGSRMAAYYPVGWLYRSKLRTNEYFDELLARVDPGQRRWFRDRPLPSARENIKDDALSKGPYILFGMLTGGVEACEKRFVQAETMQDHLRIACALERFWLARGTYPETLAELVPDYLAAVPREIVNGAPYQYRRTEGAFVLYSIGDWVWSSPSRP